MNDIVTTLTSLDGIAGALGFMICVAIVALGLFQ